MQLTKNLETPVVPAVDLWMQIQFSSLRAVVPGICQAAVALASGSTAGESPKLMIVLRELLGNAIEHGNQDDSGRAVDFRMRLIGARGVELSVSDEGSGFDAALVDLSSLSSPGDTRGSGLRLVNALCDSIRFENGGRRVVCRLSWDTDLRMAELAVPTRNVKTH
jgi:anti-sigma regulatory factor (Ser/Thr protein kinase)